MFGNHSSLKIPKQIHQFRSRFKGIYKNTKIVLCVPSTLIYFFKKKISSKYISIGAQNCHYHQSYGSYTGSISPLMLKQAGAKYVIIGHSENRLQGDTNKIIKKKINSALKEKLIIIFCIGETLTQKKKGKTFSILKKQIGDSIERKFEPNKIFFAYEPIWSIGTGKIPKPEDLKKIFKFISKELMKRNKRKTSPVLLYGGSVNGKNVKLFSSISEISGFLIGGASQSSKKFIDIIKNYYK